MKKSLTEEQVLYCRANYQPNHLEFGLKGLAQKFGVSRDTIKDIVHGKTYKTVGGEIHPVLERVSDETKQAIVAAYVPRSSEANVKVLAERFKLSPTTVIKILHDLTPRESRGVVTDKIRQAVLAEYVPYSGEHGRNALAEKFGLSTSTIGVILRDFPKKIRKPREKVARKPQVLLDELKEAIIIAHDEEKLSVRALADRFSLSRELVKEVLKEAGVVLRKRQVTSPELKEQVRELYRTGKYSLRELSDKYSINRATLTQWVSDIKPPKPEAPKLEQAMIERVLSFHAKGHGVAPIAKSLGLSSQLVRRIVNGEPL